MSYIGSSATPIAVAFSGVRTQSFNGTGSQTVFTLSRSVGSNSEIEVVVNNVQQSPFDGSYTVVGTALTFSESPSAGTNNIYVIYRDQAVGSIVDTTAYRRNEVDSLLDDKEDTIGYTPINKAGDTMTGNLRISNSDPAFRLQKTGGNEYQFRTDTNDAYIRSATAGIDVMKFDYSGRVTAPNQPAFEAWRGASITTTGIIVFDNVALNRGSHYNTSNGRFTVPVTGVYLIAAEVFWNGVNGRVRIDVEVNGVNRIEGKMYNPDASDYFKQTLIRPLYLVASDYVHINLITVGNGSLGGRPFTSFCGHLLS